MYNLKNVLLNLNFFVLVVGFFEWFNFFVFSLYIDGFFFLISFEDVCNIVVEDLDVIMLLY